jgi:TolB-like protein/Tfp pilus assembly protein PilF
MAGDFRARFGSFEADLETAELFNNGVSLRLQEKPFQVLALLLKTPGQLVTREEICSKTWPDVFIQNDLCLNTAICRLRAVLEMADHAASMIETVGRRGYRLRAEVILPATPPPTDSPVSPTGSCLAVLPFANLNGEPQDYFADGLTEQMIVQLGRACKDLTVISPVSSLSYKKTAKSLPEIARELQADHVLSGTVWRIPPGLRITARLVRAADRRCLWSESYDRQETEIFLVQDEITMAICRGLLRALPKSTASPAHLTTTPATYETYLRARYYTYKFDQSGFQTATQLFDQVIGEDPHFAPAHAGQALMLTAAATYGGAPPQAIYDRVKLHAAAALALCDDIPEAHIALAWNGLWAADWTAMEHGVLRALEINPSFSLAYVVHSYWLSIMGRREQAIVAAKRALELDPASPIIATTVAFVHYWGGHLKEALRYLRDCLEMDPRFCPAHLTLAFVHEAMGAPDQALGSARAAAEYNPDTPLALLALARSLALAGDSEGATNILCGVLPFRETGYLPATLIGLIYAALGQHEQAWTYLEAAVGELDPWRVFLGVDPRFKVFWNDGRFPRVLHEIGLPSPQFAQLPSIPPSA